MAIRNNRGYIKREVCLDCHAAGTAAEGGFLSCIKQYCNISIKAILSTIIILIAGGVGFQQVALAEPVLQQAPEFIPKKTIVPGTSQEKLEEVSKLPEVPMPAVVVKVPVQINDLPLSWRSGELLADVGHYYLNGNTVAGGGFGRSIIGQVLSSGSYQGEITVSANDTHGEATGVFRLVAVAAVRKGDECLVLGVAGYNSVDNEGTILDGASGVVAPCQDNLALNF